MRLPLLLATLLTAACAALTVAFLGILRGIAELRLRLSGHGSATGSTMYVDAGRALPDQLVASIPDPREDALVVFLSESCEACWRLADELTEVPAAQVAVCLQGDDVGPLSARLRADAIIVELGAARSAAEELGVDVMPLVILQRDGYIVASAHGESARTADDLRNLLASAGVLTKELPR